MFQNIWFVAAIWMALALSASLVSIWSGISVALIEIVVGVVVGNISIGGDHHILKTTEWINFLAMLGSGVLTVLAGAEIDPASLNANIRASMTIGVLSFLSPFVFVWLIAQIAAGSEGNRLVDAQARPHGKQIDQSSRTHDSISRIVNDT